MHNVYILQSVKTGKYYKGQTNNITRRLKEHNNGEEKSTSSGVPWRLVFSCEVPTLSDALRLERKLKNITSKKKVESFIDRNRKI